MAPAPPSEGVSLLPAEGAALMAPAPPSQELAEAGDSWTVVSLANHASFVQPQTKAQAVTFLHKLEREELSRVGTAAVTAAAGGAPPEDADGDGGSAVTGGGRSRGSVLSGHGGRQDSDAGTGPTAASRKKPRAGSGSGASAYE